MRRRIFLDTSYLLALVRSRDNRHGAALAASQTYLGPFLTTDLVLIELANSMASPPARQTAVAMRTKGSTVALTFDDHFRQAGFSVPLLEE